MYTRKLGKTGMEVSEIGFGAYVSASLFVRYYPGMI